MRRRTVLAQLVIFAVISVSIVAYTLFDVIGYDPTATPIRVTVRLTTGGGVFTGSEVAFRGVDVGRVDAVSLRPDGVVVRLRIDEGTRIPADSTAHVYDLSVAGEQYVDLVPPVHAGSAVLRSGDVIPASRTTTPIAVSDLLLDVQQLVRSVNPADVRTVSRELSAALTGTGPDLQRLLTSGSDLLAQLQRSKAAMARLLRNGATVLHTAAAHSADFTTFADSLLALTGTLKASTPALERLIAQAPATVRLLDGVVRENATAIGVLLGNLTTFGNIQVANIPGLRALLVAVPTLGDRLPLVTRGGTIHTAILLNYNERLCSYGIPVRSPLDPNPTAVHKVSCTLPVDIPRGAANAPTSTSRSSTRPQVTTYDPADGVVSTPNGSSVRLGYDGGQAQLYGSRSWETLLAPTGLSS